MLIGGRRETVLLLIVGLVIGVSVGLVVSREVWPAPLRFRDPSRLARRYVDDYIVLIAARQAWDGDVRRTQAQLRALRVDEGDVAHLTSQAMAEGGELRTVRSLARLCYALGVGANWMAIYLPAGTPRPSAQPPLGMATARPPAGPTGKAAPTTSPTSTWRAPRATRTPPAGRTPTPRPSPTSTSQPSFLLTERRRVCAAADEMGQVEVQVRDAQGQGLPGVRIVISWDELGGEEGQAAFFTGLKPERGSGYADFDLRERERVYAVQVSSSTDRASGLAADPVTAGCPGSGGSVTWQLTFVENWG